jgi:peptidoglycan/xylan/chitin deacetylase (PgdA/CDA1 family)
MIQISIILHAASVIVYVVHPTLWPWAIAALIGNHLALGAAVLWPQGQLLGPNWVRLPAAAIKRSEVSLTFDDGPDPEVTPQVLELLDRYQVKASFFCVGEKVAAFPALVREIARRGHSVENHSYHHSFGFACYGISRLRREVDSTQGVIANITGQGPGFFRAPAGFRSPLLDPVLARRGLQYVSWTRRGYDAIRRDPKQVLQRLAASLAAGDILMLHDSAYTRTADGQPVVISVLAGLLNEIVARGLKPVSLPIAFNDDSMA